MKILDYFNTEEQEILKDADSKIVDYLSGNAKMTFKQRKVIERYIILKMTLHDFEDDADRKENADEV